jgi:hypothetical protein
VAEDEHNPMTYSATGQWSAALKFAPRKKIIPAAPPKPLITAYVSEPIKATPSPSIINNGPRKAPAMTIYQAEKEKGLKRDRDGDLAKKRKKKRVYLFGIIENSERIMLIILSSLMRSTIRIDRMILESIRLIGKG